MFNILARTYQSHFRKDVYSHISRVKKGYANDSHLLQSKIAHLFYCIPNLCRSSLWAMIRSAWVNQFRHSWALFSNQQHTYDIYHTPAHRFSAKLKRKRSKKKVKIVYFFPMEKILRTWKFISSWMVIKNLWNYTAVKILKKRRKS